MFTLTAHSENATRYRLRYYRELMQMQQRECEAVLRGMGDLLAHLGGDGAGHRAGAGASRCARVLAALEAPQVAVYIAGGMPPGSPADKALLRCVPKSCLFVNAEYLCTRGARRYTPVRACMHVMLVFHGACLNLS